jgi:ABC-2 type transport system permease protein
MQPFDIAPPAGRTYILGVLPVLLRRQAKIWLQFRVSSVMDILTMLAQASVFFFVGKAIGGNAWTGANAGFLAVGIIANTMLQAALAGPYSSLASAYWTTRLESMLLSPCPLILQIVADVLWILINAAISALFLIVVGASFGARLDASLGDMLLAGLVIVLGLVAVLGIGFISASTFMLINAKGFNDPVAWAVGILQGLVAGAYFPPADLPTPLYALARLLPQTYAIDALRRLLLADHPPTLARIGSLSPLASDLLLLTCFTTVTTIAGFTTFRAGMRKARADGGLSRWA